MTEGRWRTLQQMWQNFPSKDRHDGKGHVASTFVGSTAHTWDHLDQVSSKDGLQLSSSTDVWGQYPVPLAWSSSGRKTGESYLQMWHWLDAGCNDPVLKIQ